MNNTAASLPAGLPYQPLGWNPITLYVDPKTHTTATLYGNDIALESSHPRTGGPVGYKAGSVLALVTWAQREDPHWFGARIPETPQSVEFVEVQPSGPASYRSFSGSRLSEVHPAAAAATQRSSFTLGLTPARLP